MTDPRTTPMQDNEFSNMSVGKRRLTWQEFAEWQANEIRRLSQFAQIVADLDRNENGRHEGDYDSSDPTGVSQGNPHIREGQTIGYTVHGTHAYVMPARNDRHRPEAWVVRKDDDA